MRRLAILCLTFDKSVEPDILTFLQQTQERAEQQGIPCTFYVDNADEPGMLGPVASA